MSFKLIQFSNSLWSLEAQGISEFQKAKDEDNAYFKPALHLKWGRIRRAIPAQDMLHV